MIGAKLCEHRSQIVREADICVFLGSVGHSSPGHFTLSNYFLQRFHSDDCNVRDKFLQQEYLWLLLSVKVKVNEFVYT